MKTSVKVLLGFIAGAAVGTAGTALYFKRELDKINQEFSDKINEQMEEIKREYKEAVAEIEKECDNSLEKESEEPIQEEKPAKKTKEQKKEESTDYTKYSEDKKKKGTKTTVKDVKAEAIEQIQQEITNEEGNYIITAAEYTDDNGYEKVTFNYYPQEDIYTNDYDDPDPDAPYIVGDLVNKLDDYGEGNCLYIRSDQRESDYEIIFNEKAYGEE